MRYYKNKKGPFPVGVFLEDAEIESAALEQTHKANIYPSIDHPYVNADLILEKNFGITPDFEDLEDGVLGKAEFYKNGQVRVLIARLLGEECNGSKENLYRTTLAHEIGHVVLHRILFLDDTLKFHGVSQSPDAKYPVLCRGDQTGYTIKEYSGEWWEWQANRFMSALLMPRQPTIKMCEELRNANLGATTSDLKQLLIQRMSVEMKVSRQACEIRLNQLKICQANENQIELAI